MNPDAVKYAIQKLIAYVDYDTYKLIENPEDPTAWNISGREDGWDELVKLFEVYYKRATGMTPESEFQK